MPTFTDQTGEQITLNEKPQRIISVVPSQSELLWDLGLRNELAGITKFCIHPNEMFTGITRVGGTKKLDIEKIRAIKPDLIIGNKEENQKEQIELLRGEFNVWMSDIYTFDDALEMMNGIGRITGKQEEAKKITAGIKNFLPEIAGMFNDESVLYFIWKEPWMLAAKKTFIDHVLTRIGFTNAAHKFTRYPELDENSLRNLNPDYCFLSSEPYPFKEKHFDEISSLLPKTKVMIVDGEMFSWYGSR
jgi:ABC-type Fe3+-hydroxamate transport system substrate-binding protein